MLRTSLFYLGIVACAFSTMACANEVGAGPVTWEVIYSITTDNRILLSAVFAVSGHPADQERLATARQFVAALKQDWHVQTFQGSVILDSLTRNDLEQQLAAGISTVRRRIADPALLKFVNTGWSAGSAAPPTPLLSQATLSAADVHIAARFAVCYNGNEAPRSCESYARQSTNSDDADRAVIEASCGRKGKKALQCDREADQSYAEEERQIAVWQAAYWIVHPNPETQALVAAQDRERHETWADKATKEENQDGRNANQPSLLGSFLAGMVAAAPAVMANRAGSGNSAASTYMPPQTTYAAPAAAVAPGVRNSAPFGPLAPGIGTPTQRAFWAQNCQYRANDGSGAAQGCAQNLRMWRAQPAQSASAQPSVAPGTGLGRPVAGAIAATPVHCVTMRPQSGPSLGFWVVVNQCSYSVVGNYRYDNDPKTSAGFGPLSAGQSEEVTPPPGSGNHIWHTSSCIYDEWNKGICHFK